MNLLKSATPRDYETRVLCCASNHSGSRMFVLAAGYADLDGEPYRAYYCDGCAARLNPAAVLASTIRTAEG
jgi:hypothetical protein